MTMSMLQWDSFDMLEKVLWMVLETHFDLLTRSAMQVVYARL